MPPTLPNYSPQRSVNFLQAPFPSKSSPHFSCHTAGPSYAHFSAHLYVSPPAVMGRRPGAEGYPGSQISVACMYAR